NVVYECLENSIPFLAGNRGGAPELVAAEDRARTFAEPTVGGIREALAALRADPGSMRPAGASFDFDAVRSTGRDLPAMDRRPARSAADIVTCGVRTRRGRREEVRLFLGEPRALGVVANYYGSIGLYRRSLLERYDVAPAPEGHRSWARLAQLSLDGARIVSVP